MTTSTRFVQYALGAALIISAVGTAAAEPPRPQEGPREDAVARSSPAPPPMSAVASPSPGFSPAESRGAVERSTDRSPGSFGRAPRAIDVAPTPVRFSESGEAGDGQARQRVPPSSGGGSRAGGGSAGRPSGGGSGRPSGGSSQGAGTARPRGGDGYVAQAPRSGGGYRGDPASGSGTSRRYPYYGPGGSGGQGGSGYAVRRGTVPGSGYYPHYDYYRPYRPSYYYPYYGNWGLGFYFWDPSWYGWGG